MYKSIAMKVCSVTIPGYQKNRQNYEVHTF